MQNYYIPCAQQDRHQGFHKGQEQYQNSYQRSAPPFRHTTPQQQWSVSQQDSHSQTPSLGHSSASSQDGLSPKTPESLSSDDTDAVDPDQGIKSTLHGPKRENGCKVSAFLCRNLLPSRPKTSGLRHQSASQPSGESTDLRQHNVPSVIHETAVRSRLARPSGPSNVGVPAGPSGSAKKPTAVVTFNSRCHARRRTCAETASAAPPKLKRDTDCTDAIVRLIVCFSTKLVHAIWSESAATPRNSNAFNGAGVLPLRVFIQETLRRSKTSYSTLQVALFYLILLKPYIGTYHQSSDTGTPACRALQCGRRMFLTALILASKYLQDRNYSSRAWSKISGLPISEINENERRYLNLIQFNLHMKKETFENWSKIVLTLCKVGETSMNQDLAKESSRHRSNEMSDIMSPAGDDEAKSGSEQWWLHQLSRLSADLVQDSPKTEEYLKSLTSGKADAAIDSDRLMASLETPPSSPDSATDVTTDKQLERMSTEASSSSSSSHSHQVADFQSSPASVTSLPTRPSLPNLPTPQTTPRYTRTLPLPNGSGHTAVRCRASSRALLGLERHVVNAANLDTCPPPQPRVHEMLRQHQYARREGSCLANSGSAVAAVNSPESTVSDLSSCAPRSRSSSMSSTSSVWWPSGAHQSADELSGRQHVQRKDNAAPQASTTLSEVNVPSMYSFYHNSVPMSKVFEDEGVGMGSQLGGQASSDSRLCRFQDEGYGSDATACIERDARAAETEATNGLALLNVCKDTRSAKCPAEALQTSAEQHLVLSNTQSSGLRKHKRDRSSVSEEILHNHVRSFLWDEQQPHVLVNEVAIEADDACKEQLQYPAKEWACPKKPITNVMRTKRFAMHHETTKACSSDLAALYLRDDVTFVS